MGTNAKRPAVLNWPLPCFSTHLQVKGKKQGIVGEMVTKMSLSGWEKEEHGRGSAHARHSALLPTLIPRHSSSSSSCVPLNHRRISHHQNPSDAIRMTLNCGSSVCDIYPRYCVPQMMVILWTGFHERTEGSKPLRIADRVHTRPRKNRFWTQQPRNCRDILRVFKGSHCLADYFLDVLERDRITLHCGYVSNASNIKR